MIFSTIVLQYRSSVLGVPLTPSSCRSFISVGILNKQDAKCLHASVRKKHLFQILCKLTYAAGFAFVYTDTGSKINQLDPSLPSQKKFSLEKMFIHSIFLPKLIFSVMQQGRSLVPSDSEVRCLTSQVRTSGLCILALFLSTFCLRHHHQVQK